MLRWGEIHQSYRHGAPGGSVPAVLSGQSIRAVALGIVVTALVQSVIGGIGLAITRVPYPVLLTAAMSLLAVARIGGGPVLFGAVVKLYGKDQTLGAPQDARLVAHHDQLRTK